MMTKIKQLLGNWRSAMAAVSMIASPVGAQTAAPAPEAPAQPAPAAVVEAPDATPEASVLAPVVTWQSWIVNEKGKHSADPAVQAADYAKLQEALNWLELAYSQEASAKSYDTTAPDVSVVDVQAGLDERVRRVEANVWLNYAAFPYADTQTKSFWVETPIIRTCIADDRTSERLDELKVYKGLIRANMASLKKETESYGISTRAPKDLRSDVIPACVAIPSAYASVPAEDRPTFIASANALVTLLMTYSQDSFGRPLYTPDQICDKSDRHVYVTSIAGQAPGFDAGALKNPMARAVMLAHVSMKSPKIAAIINAAEDGKFPLQLTSEQAKSLKAAAKAFGETSLPPVALFSTEAAVEAPKKPVAQPSGKPVEFDF